MVPPHVEWVLDIRSDWLTPVFKTATKMGNGTFLFTFTAIGYWVWRREAFARIGVLIGVTIVLNALLKDVIQDPRPDTIERLIPTRGYGFPSGHAQIAIVLWGWIALELRRPWAWLACSIIATAVIFSRLYLGVHDVPPATPEVSGQLGSQELFVFDEKECVSHLRRPTVAAG